MPNVVLVAQGNVLDVLGYVGDGVDEGAYNPEVFALDERQLACGGALTKILDGAVGGAVVSHIGPRLDAFLRLHARELLPYIRHAVVR